MANKFQRFFILIAFLLVKNHIINSEESFDEQFNDTVTRYLNTALPSVVTDLVLSALEEYTMGHYQESTRLLDQAIALTTDNADLLSLKKSVERLYNLRLSDSGVPPSKKEVKLDWGSADKREIDKNRFLFRSDIHLDFSTITTLGAKPEKLAIGGSIEGFLPQKDRMFGLHARVSSYFFDISSGKKSSDYEIWEYQLAFQWRLGWSLPGLEQRVTLAMRFGVTTQHIILFKESSFPTPELAYYLLPSFELYVQDALLYYLVPNGFTENLLFAPLLSFAWLPAGRAPTTLFNTGIAITYRFGSFTFGPSYHFRYQYNIKTKQSLRYSTWSLLFSYQY